METGRSDDRSGGGGGSAPAVHDGVRRWGTPPHRVVLVHGGPAAPSTVAVFVALLERELAARLAS